MAWVVKLPIKSIPVLPPDVRMLGKLAGVRMIIVQRVRVIAAGSAVLPGHKVNGVALSQTADSSVIVLYVAAALESLVISLPITFMLGLPLVVSAMLVIRWFFIWLEVISISADAGCILQGHIHAGTVPPFARTSCSSKSASLTTLPSSLIIRPDLIKYLLMSGMGIPLVIEKE